MLITSRLYALRTQTSTFALVDALSRAAYMDRVASLAADLTAGGYADHAATITRLAADLRGIDATPLDVACTTLYDHLRGIERAIVAATHAGDA